jgi:hypothetical protein
MVQGSEEEGDDEDDPPPLDEGNANNASLNRTGERIQVTRGAESACKLYIESQLLSCACVNNPHHLLCPSAALKKPPAMTGTAASELSPTARVPGSRSVPFCS